MKKGAILLTISVLICMGLLFVGLWPFRLNVKNQMSWESSGGGLRSDRFGISYTTDTLNICNSTKDAFTIELAVQSLSLSEDRISRLLSIMDTDKEEKLIIGEWRDYLIVRFKSGSSRDGFVELDADEALPEGKPAHVIITYGNGAISLFTNGVKIIDSTPLTLPSIEGIMILGNSPSGRDGWTGEWNALRISHDTVSDEVARNHYSYWRENGVFVKNIDNTIANYLFNEQSGNIARNEQSPSYTLFLPKNMERKDFQILHLPFDEFSFRKGYLMDVALNSLGFIPLGYCLALLILVVKKMSYKWLLLWTTFSGGIISLTIEVLQAFMPTRSSQFSDFFLNTAGTLVGALFCLIPLLIFRGKHMS